MRQSMLAVMAALLTSLASAAEVAKEPAKEPVKESATARPPEFKQAQGQFRAGDFDAALATLREAAKKYPEMPPPTVVLARFALAANQPINARTWLEQAIVESPADPEAYAMLGESNVRNRQLTEAGLLYGKIVEIVAAKKDPSPREIDFRRQALAGLAMVAENHGDWVNAEKFYRQLQAEDPKNGLVLQQLGRVLFEQKKLDEARKLLEEAAAADPSILHADANLAKFHQQAGEAATASKHLVAAIKAKPNDLNIRLFAAEWSLAVGRPEQAAAQATKALEIDAKSAEAKARRGEAALFLKDYKTAEEMFGQVHLAAPSNFAVTNRLALALAEQPERAKKELALEYAQVNARIGPDQPEANAMLGWVQYRLGRLDEAEASFRKALGTGRTNAETYYFYARLMADRNNKDEARAAVDRALKIAAPFPMRSDAEALAAELK